MLAVIMGYSAMIKSECLTEHILGLGLIAVDMACREDALNLSSKHQKRDSSC